MTISGEDRERRRRSVRDAIASARLEGREVSQQTQSDMSRYAEGEITEDQMLERFHRHVQAVLKKPDLAE